MKTAARSHALSRFVLLCLAGAFAATGLALDPTRAVKDYQVSEWQVTDGLPYPSVNAISQSSDGYLWLGTRTGLVRFDGITFATFTQKNLPALSDDRVSMFYQALDGTLWAGTGRGLIRYRNGAWERVPIGKTVDEGLIWAICETADDAMLVAVFSGEMTFSLHRVRHGQTEEILLTTGRSAPRLNSVRHSRHGTLFAGIGMFKLVENSLEDISAEVGVDVRRQVLALERDEAGTIWIATPVGLMAWDGAKATTLTTRDGLPSNSVRSLLFDSDRNLWVGTSNGLARYAGGFAEELIVRGTERLTHVLSLFEDRERNVWVGTDNGLICLRDPKVTSFAQRDGLPVNPVLCVLPARDGTHWIGTIGGGLAHRTPSGVRTLTIADGLAEDSIGALAEDASGGLWIAYYTRGVSYYKDGAVKHYATGDPVRVRGLAVGPDGNVWALHSSSLFKLVDDTFQPVLTAREFKHFRALHLAADGAVWISTAQSIARLREGEWTHFPTPPARRDQYFQYILSTRDGAIWALQDGPVLVRIKNDHRTDIVLPTTIGPLIYSGLEHGGDLWISFRTGIGRMRLEDLDAVAAGRKAAPNVTLFNETDGMRSPAPNNIGSPGSIAATDGSLWFATSMGLALIDPARLRANRQPPDVVIEHVYADKVEYPANQLRIPPGRGELAFHFTAPTFVNPLRARFKYRLHGFDADWVDAGRRREAHYGGLRPGTYRFEVAAANSEGVPSRESAVRELVLLPHFYQRWWFFATMGLAVAGVGAGLQLWRSRRLQRRAVLLQRQNEELEQRIAERTAELRQSYDALRSSEYFYHSLVESLPQVIARKDVNGRYTYANGGFCQLVARAADEVIGRTDEELLPPELSRKMADTDQRVSTSRQTVEYEEIVQPPGGTRQHLHVKKVALVDRHGALLGIQLLCWDMTVFRETEDKLRSAQKELLEISRLAGIAEMATGVLHNLGNALNSVKVAATIAVTKGNRLSVGRVNRVAQMLEQETHRLPEFFASDPRGAKLPGYLTLLATQLETERAEMLRELQDVSTGIEHVAQIVAAQQASARVAGIVEEVSASELMDDACRMNEAGVSRRGIALVREFSASPTFTVERQKVLQILANLVRNAAEALATSQQPEKRIVLGIVADAHRVHFSVSDNGVGIASASLGRIFEFGYTTKKTGHGFGLHNSALTAKEIGGALRVHSAGENQGATFTLELPLAPPDRVRARTVELGAVPA